MGRAEKKMADSFFVFFLPIEKKKKVKGEKCIGKERKNHWEMQRRIMTIVFFFVVFFLLSVEKKKKRKVGNKSEKSFGKKEKEKIE